MKFFNNLRIILAIFIEKQIQLFNINMRKINGHQLIQ